MTINGLKDLAKIIALCRKTGVTSIEVDGIKLNLGPVSSKLSKATPRDMAIFDPGAIPSYTPSEPDAKIITDALSEEELMFYSSDSPSGELS